LSAGEPFSVPPSVLPLIRKGQELYQRSDGLFNPALGELIRLWGFASDDPPQGPPPDKASIEQLLAQHPSMLDLRINGLEMACTNPAVRLDFGGFAKGYGVDLAIQHLRELGIENAIINAGGNLRVIGRHGDRPWRIGIRNPRGEGVMASVDAEGDESIFTSGDYERYFEYEGQRYHHIMDPRTGYPARGTESVTIFHTNGADADGASTALFVAGPEHWQALAKKMGVTGVMLVAEDGTVYMTPNLKERIHFVETPARLVLSEPL
jgi:thiamine biosynthesis lipoprotein